MKWSRHFSSPWRIIIHLWYWCFFHHFYNKPNKINNLLWIIIWKNILLWMIISLPLLLWTKHNHKSLICIHHHNVINGVQTGDLTPKFLCCRILIFLKTHHIYINIHCLSHQSIVTTFYSILNQCFLDTKKNLEH